jgi:hypothetical protein
LAAASLDMTAVRTVALSAWGPFDAVQRDQDAFFS